MLYECQVWAIPFVLYLTVISTFHPEKKCSQVRQTLPQMSYYLWHMKLITTVYLKLLVRTNYMANLHTCAENSIIILCML